MKWHANNRRLLAGVVSIVAISHALSLFAGDGDVTEDELAQTRQWSAARLSAAEVSTNLEPPFSFTYDETPSRQLLPGWDLRREVVPLDSQRTRHVLTWTCPKTGLVVRSEGVAYRDFPVVEWTLYLKNNGSTATPILEDIQTLDAVWQRGSESEFLLHHGVGSPANGSDYGPLETALEPGVAKRVSAQGGRPTNSDLSYFNLQWGTAGVIVAVGWPGQWSAEFARDEATGIRVRAGQELTHFKLLPGEEVRSPLIALLFWQGDWIRGQNLWRRWMMAHSMPKPGGKLPPPQFVASSSRAYEEMIGANEANQIMHIDRYLEEGLKLDYWWMDAGWYIQQQGWPQVGTWEIDPRRFPHGFRPISDHAHARDVKILVWFEPERVTPGTWLYHEHPEWLLNTYPGQQHPLDGMRSWSASGVNGGDPCVTHNPTDRARTMSRIRWEPKSLAFHPGAHGEYSVVRFTVPEAGVYDAHAEFMAIDQDTTTEVQVLQDGRCLFRDLINLEGRGRKTEFSDKLTLAKNDTLEFVVGTGNGTHMCDSTGLDVRLTAPSGTVYDAARDFHASENPRGPWSYGFLKPGTAPQVDTFQLYDRPGEPGTERTRLLNLGNPDARQWLTDHVDRLLTEQGIDLYRQDFNMDPLAFWRAADAPDRQGITEIKHVTGYLAYWDELRRRHPNLLIDTCASGGRRNDLETLRRAVPLWRSDYAFEPIGHQCMTYGISLWIPYHGTGTVACANATYYGGGATPVEPYAFWSNVAPSLGSGIDIRVREIDYDALRRLVHQWRELSPCYYGDYYPLTPWSREKNVWIGWQFDRGDLGVGVVQAFRRDECTDDTIQLKLRGLDPETQYEFTQLDAPGTTTASGSQLMTFGLTVSLADRPAAAVLMYRRLSTQ